MLIASLSRPHQPFLNGLKDVYIMTEEAAKEVFVGLPGFIANGDPMDDQIKDAVAEALEVNPTDVEVIEKDNKFYVFIKSLDLTFTTANQTVARANKLSQTYEHSVSRLTKLVQRADKYQKDLNSLRKEVAELTEEKQKLERTLEQEQAERQKQLEMSKTVEANVQALINTLSSK